MCLSVRDGSGMFEWDVREASDARPLYFNLLNLELREECSDGLESSRTSRCNWGTAVEADTFREQQLKRMQSGSSS